MKQPFERLNLSLPVFLVLIASCSDSSPTGPDLSDLHYQLVELNVAGSERASVTSISPDGTILGGSASVRVGGVLTEVAAIWLSNGQRVDIPAFAGLSAGIMGIENNGAAVGWTTQEIEVDWPSVPGIVSGSSWTRLPTLSAPHEFGSAKAISNGVVVGIAVDEDWDVSEPWVRENGVTRSLGSFGGESGDATDVNTTGQIVGWSQVAGEPWRSEGFLVQPGGTLATATRIAGLGGNTTFVRAVNDFGTVLGDSADPGGRTHGFIWSASAGITQIVSPPQGANFVISRSINNHNQVVGDGPSSDGSPEAWYWDRVNGKLALDSMVDLPTGWRIIRAWSIANDGSIAATARDGSGNDRAVVLRPSR